MTMRQYIRAATVAVIAVLLLVPIAARCQGNLEIHCIDVGQGDCTLVISPTGGTLLFDAGWNAMGNSVVIPYLQSLGITGLDYVCCSHYHADHIGGLDEVVNSLGIDSLRVAALDRGWSYTTLTYSDYAAAVAPKRTTILDGQIIDLGGGVTVTCIGVNGNGALSPPFAGSDDENDYCVSLLVEYGDFEFFVAGDLSGVNSSSYTDIETSVALEIGDLDVYRVDHHGSASNSNANLVSTFQPEVSIISVGSNSYGHPTQTVLNRLVSYGSYIYQTEVGSGGTIPPGEGEVVGGHVVIVVGAGQYTVDGDPYDLGSSGVRIAGREISLKVFPNPFTSQTTFGFSVPEEGRVTLDVFDTTGRFINGFSTPGSASSSGTLTWDGRTFSGESVSPGVYFVRLRGASAVTAHKVVKR
ncbi:MAG: MBL fold metallo-hydrolase [Candidatus Eisenbacteria bacterium]